MKLPKKISPDNITNSLVHISYWSSIPNIPSIGYIYGHLSSKNYIYIDNESIENHLYVNEEKGVKVQFSLFNDVKILSFNCIDSYLGWEKYSEEINSIIKTLIENGVVSKVHKVKLQYSSLFQENVFDNLRLTLDVGNLKSSRHDYSLKDQKYNVEIFLDINLEETSDYKIEVSVENLEEKELTKISEFAKLLNEVHLREKKVFFSLISEKKLIELNPEY